MTTYSLQLAAPKAPRLRKTAQRRAEAWALLLSEFLAVHPGRTADSVTVLEVSAWQASARRAYP